MKRNAIVAVVDDTYLPFAYALFSKIRKLGSQSDCFVLLNSKSPFPNFLDFKKINVGMIYINENMDRFNKLSNSRHVTNTTYGKFLIPQIFNNQYSKILYLDTDILVRRNPDFLFRFGSGNEISAVLETHGNGKKLFQNSDTNYFNAGVILFNLDLINLKSLEAQLFELVEMHGDLEYQDQDYFNLIYQNNWGLLPITANVFAETPTNIYHFKALADPLIVHFNGPFKPWNTSSNLKYFVEWQNEFRSFLPEFNIGFHQKLKSSQNIFYKLKSTFLGKWFSNLLPVSIKKFLINFVMRF